MIGHRSLGYFNDHYSKIGKLNLIINDCTLREGEQSPFVNFRPEQKLRLAKRLSDLGVHQIQVGYPGLSKTDLEIFQELKTWRLAARLEAVILGYLPNWEQQIEATIASGASVAMIVYVTSTPRRKEVFRVTDEEARARIVELVSRVKAAGLTVSFAPADTTRTELPFLLDMIAAAQTAGADRIFIADSLGCSTPGGIRWLYEKVREACSLPLQYHGHNDFGLALANALTGIECGATIVDTTLNGWGDRTGNPPTEELVAALELLYQNPTGVDIVGIAQLAREVAHELDAPVSPMKPITGSLAFAHKLESHVQAVLRHPPAFESFDPAIVGGRRQVALGQYSGPEGVAARLEQAGISLDPKSLPRLVDRVREAARETNRVLDDTDLRHLISELRG